MAFSKKNVRTHLDYEIIDKLLEGFQLISYDWRYLFVNKTVCKHAKTSKENLLGHTMMEKYPGIENTKMFKVLEKCMRNRVSDTLENEFTYPDGTIGWFELRVVPVSVGIFILSVDITERKKYEQELLNLNKELERRVKERTADLEKANQEITALYKEMHHRIKNSLQIVASLLSLHAMSSDNELVSNELLESRNRIKAIAQVHENLYAKDRLKSLNIKTFIKELIERQIEVNSDNSFSLSINVDCVSIERSIDFLVPFGLIINELITNSIKHGFKGKNEGIISVKIYIRNDLIILDYQDNGNGPKTIKVDGTGLGSILINSLVDQLKGKLEESSKINGVHYIISTKI